MKSTFVSFFVLLAMVLNAQNGEYYFTSNPFEYDATLQSNDLKQTLMNNHVKSISENITTYKNGQHIKDKRKIVYLLNEKGETIQKEEFNSRGQLMRKHQYVLNDSGWVVQKIITNGKGRILFQYDKQYDLTTGNILSYEYRKNNKLKTKYTATYAGIYLTSKTIYKKDGRKTLKRFEYLHNSDMKLQTTHLYNGKGRIIHTWNHDCLPEGELLQARKDTTTICKLREDFSDGRFTTYIKSVNEKGELTTTTYWFNNESRSDSVRIVTEGKHPTTQIIRLREDRRYIESIITNKDSIIINKYLEQKSESGNQIQFENWMYKNKQGLQCFYRIKGEENAQGLLTKSTSFYQQNPYQERVFTYTFY